MSFGDNVTVQCYNETAIKVYGGETEENLKSIFKEGFPLSEFTIKSITKEPEAAVFSITFNEVINTKLTPALVLEISGADVAEFNGRWRIRAVKGNDTVIFFKKKSVASLNDVPSNLSAITLKVAPVGMKYLEIRRSSGYWNVVPFFGDGTTELISFYLYLYRESFSVAVDGNVKHTLSLNYPSIFAAAPHSLILSGTFTDRTEAKYRTSLFFLTTLGDDSFAYNVGAYSSVSYVMQDRESLYNNFGGYIKNSPIYIKLKEHSNYIYENNKVFIYTQKPRLSDKTKIAQPYVSTTTLMQSNKAFKVPGYVHLIETEPSLCAGGLYIGKDEQDNEIPMYVVYSEDESSEVKLNQIVTPLADEFWVIKELANRQTWF
jgi:hypothetical protein